MYTELRGQHLSQEKVGERHFALIQHTVPTEFPGRSYSAMAPGGKTAKGASQACPVHPSRRHTSATNLTLRQTPHCCNPDPWDKGHKLELRSAGCPCLYIWQIHPLHFQMQSFEPSPCSSWLPSEGHDIHVFHMQVHASQAFLGAELSFTGLLLEVCETLYLPPGGKVEGGGAKICPC